jgi:hypothetical protein
MKRTVFFLAGLVAALLLGASLRATAQPKQGATMTERFLSVEGLTLVGDALPTEAEIITVRRFQQEVQRYTGRALPVVWGDRKRALPCLVVGNRATLGADFPKGDSRLPEGPTEEDAANQSYIVAMRSPKASKRPEVLVAGGGQKRTARGYLGLGYALGELLRRLDQRNGRWGFVLPAEPIVARPKMLNRTLYLMNSNHCNPGLSLEFFDDLQIEDYVDRLVEARYSRVSLWQWSNQYLYPGNAEDRRARNQRTHQVMRKVFDRARKRGLEIYHQLTPAHATVELLPNDPKFVATGYYGRTSVCWSQPEARALARKMAQTEMEYYGPVDGYIVWFYDPGGCFCQECATHQSDRLFDQLMTVVHLAKEISPTAKFEAVLWPTWIFPEYPHNIGFPGKGYTAENVRTFVSDFLAKCRKQFGARGLTILDSCEADNTNIYNGFVKPEEFQRNAFMYTALGLASEQAYPFAAFKLQYLQEQMGKARERGLEEGLLFIQYAATNYPGVFAFADTLYEARTSWEDTAARLVSRLAKGEAKQPLLNLLTAMEDLARAKRLTDAEKAVQQVEQAWGRLEHNPGFFGDRAWLKGYVVAQRCYLQLAQTTEDKTFTDILTRFRADLSALPMYQDYATHSLQPALVRRHLQVYWNFPEKAAR